MREAGALFKIGRNRANIEGGCRKVRLKLDQSKELTRIRSGGWDISLSQVYIELVQQEAGG